MGSAVGLAISIEKQVRGSCSKLGKKALLFHGKWSGARRVAVDHRSGSVVDGSQQASDIAKRAGFCAPLRKRGRGLAFEVDNICVSAGDQDLTEMKIAMDAGFKRGAGGFRKPVHRGDDKIT